MRQVQGAGDVKTDGAQAPLAQEDPDSSWWRMALRLATGASQAGSERRGPSRAGGDPELQGSRCLSCMEKEGSA